MALTRRELLLALPGMAIAGRALGQTPYAPLSVGGLHQVTLAVSDVARSLYFYQNLFGAPIQARRGTTFVLRIGDGPQFLAISRAGAAEPHMNHFGMSIAGFDPERVVSDLGGFGITAVDSGAGLSVGALQVRSLTRGGTPEVFMGDRNGLVVQLQDPSYCGGGGPLGATCGPPEIPRYEGSLSLNGISHLTINVTDPEATNAFYQEVFGFGYQAYQGPSPILGVGPNDHFLMFINLGDAGRGGADGAVHHACLTVADFDVDRVIGVLEDHGITPRDRDGPGAMRHWISMRMPNRGGAPEGTPELYFSDPDGLSIQLQDAAYCGGGGYLGEVCG
jgi:catechol 2,3-dioxygenase-like lactoylglutathione lyase family enzyme